MKCPKCGTTNGKTNKFCRECGLKLETLPPEPQQQDSSACAPDEVALGEELFEVWQDYSAGNLDTALARAEKIIRCTPDSASAHNILALIYERKADRELVSGSIESYQGFLKHAIAEYEKIIDLNPNSAADREKLASLRVMLTGQPASVPPAAKHIFDFRAAIIAVPPPILAGVGAMLVMLILGLVFFVPGPEAARNDHPAKSVRTPVESESPAAVRSVATPGATQASPAPESTGLRVYTFPDPAPRTSAGKLTPPRQTVPPVPSGERTHVAVEPVKLPPLAGAEVSVVPESKGSATKSETPKPDRENAPEPPKSQISISVPKPEEPSNAGPDAAGTLARAIELHNQGKKEEALGAARQAVELFQADVDAGRNASTAKRGAENARKLIQLWQQSAASE